MNPTDPNLIDSLLMPGHLVLAISLLIVVAFVGTVVFPFLLQRGLMRALRNGFGDLLALKTKDVVNQELTKQDERTAVALARAVTVSDDKNEHAFRRIEDKVDATTAMMGDLHRRVKHLEDERG
jgi:putative ribosome biogenesis GTPase RsgA